MDVEKISVHGILVEFGLGDLVKQSRLIIEGQVSESTSSTTKVFVGNTENYPLIYSEHRIVVLSSLKSEVGDLISQEIKVRTLGGQAGNLSITIEQEAQLAANETALLFLGSDNVADSTELPKGTFSVVGGFQGKYTISSSIGGARTARRIDQRPIALTNLLAEIRSLNNDGLAVGAG